MLGVCTPDMQFVYALPSWKGSVVNGRVLRDSINRRHGLKGPHGKVFNMYKISKSYIDVSNLNNNKLINL